MDYIKPDADYQAFLREGRFMIQRGRTSGQHHFYPRAIEPGTGHADLDWVPASGLGTVYATTVVRARIVTDESQAFIVFDPVPAA